MGNLFIENQTQYDFFDTADGSPSICLSSDMFRPEAMHHRQGALTESLFVYHGVLKEALERECPPQILSVGLGCGYNEMITVAHFLNTETGLPVDFYLESFEGDLQLRQVFNNWLIDQAPDSPLEKSLSDTFERVSLLVAEHFFVEHELLKATLRDLIEAKKINIREWLTTETDFSYRFGVIYFDAFSGKSTPELWTEDFLFNFLARASAPQSGLATYAATGALNRALKRSGFILKEQPGFSGKRQSTRAFRS
ncbi:MAG: hypothetical protein KDD38_09025 [Bdellovibrionales bacterium]|nr:hypothetical protein [Bdellovibrionales bacterium]